MNDVIEDTEAGDDIEEVSQQCPHCDFKTPFTNVFHKHVKWLHNTFRQQIIANLQQQTNEKCVDAATIAMIATTTRLASRMTKRQHTILNDNTIVGNAINDKQNAIETKGNVV